ncbi:DUF1643 domain-containing protein [Pseudogemmobacter sp. W21_MBD1_M6]|uniref:DUF1643 domain-containing protein n=1 Tax=Pseudogemmobacter sp. W21_MBD1_M6 TaxID=3240271 RepID=UPI003F9E463A
MEFDPSTQHDPGGKVRLALPEGVIGGATFSDCGRYRQSLSRDWTPTGQVPRTIMFLGQNPSVAGIEVSDPTCHKEVSFAMRWGFTRYLKGNMLDWRATSPTDVPNDPDLACSPANIPALLDMAAESELIVLAYGNLHKRHQQTVGQILTAIRATGVPLYCLGLNKDGSAKHPLYLRNDTDLIEFPNT